MVDAVPLIVGIFSSKWNNEVGEANSNETKVLGTSNLLGQVKEELKSGR